MISDQKVKYIAKLARLGLTKKEVSRIGKDLSAILDYAKEMQKLNLTKVEPCSHPHYLKNVMRKDKAKPADQKQSNDLIKLSPDKKGRHIRVKTVF